MKLCKGKNLQKLKIIIDTKQLFKAKLKSKMFLCVLEILYNVFCHQKQCRQEFPKKILKKIKTNEVFLRELLNHENSVKSRKTKFIKHMFLSFFR